MVNLSVDKLDWSTCPGVTNCPLVCVSICRYVVIGFLLGDIGLEFRFANS
ncbi:hypothetical protein TUM4438_08770 [Shewanella sairae]|uniref:Uncharacterized protein n=1 Tax=Shewanella sairae TaxID=190310 RepID=A0ABQ4P4E7_9GAMM|nr:hypothetical protein TUM4438_08770 [Shewanella sairae]